MGELSCLLWAFWRKLTIVRSLIKLLTFICQYAILVNYLQQSGSAGLFGWWLILPRPMRVGWTSKWCQQRQSSTGSLFRSQSNAVHVTSSWQSWPHTLKVLMSGRGVPPSPYLFNSASKWGSHTAGRNKWFTQIFSITIGLVTYINEHMASWWRHQIETFSALLALCAGNSPVAGAFPAQRPVTRSFDGFFDERLNKRLSKQSWGW